MPAPRRTFTLEVGRDRSPYHQKLIRSANRTAFGVAQELFPDIKSEGEHYEGNTYRFMSPTWGWIWVTWAETVDDDYADPA